MFMDGKRRESERECSKIAHSGALTHFKTPRRTVTTCQRVRDAMQSSKEYRENFNIRSGELRDGEISDQTATPRRSERVSHTVQVMTALSLGFLWGTGEKRCRGLNKIHPGTFGHHTIVLIHVIENKKPPNERV